MQRTVKRQLFGRSTRRRRRSAVALLRAPDKACVLCQLRCGAGLVSSKQELCTRQRCMPGSLLRSQLGIQDDLLSSAPAAYARTCAACQGRRAWQPSAAKARTSVLSRAGRMGQKLRSASYKQSTCLNCVYGSS